MPSSPHRSSFDIVSARLSDPEPPSPAPTYFSTFHSQKDIPNTNHCHHSSSSEPVWQDEKSTNREKSLQQPPFDTNPDPHNTLIRPSPPRCRRSHLLHILPWALALFFFLTTLWLTSIAVGVKFLNILRPAPTPQPAAIHVIINGNPNGNPAGAPLTPLVSIVTATPTQTTTSAPAGGTPQPDAAPVAGDDPQDNTVKPVVGGTTAFEGRAVLRPTTLVTVTASKG